MKKFYSAMVVLSFLLGSCAVLSPAEPTATPIPPTPTPTPDPCSPELLINEIEDLQALVKGFQASMIFANSIQDPKEVIAPILELQDIQLQIRILKVPDCLEKLKSMVLDYTDSVVFYLIFYLNQNITQEDFDQLVNTSNQKWSLVQGEFNAVLSNLGLPTSSIPEFNQSLPETEGTGATVLNESTSAVNVRSAPNTDAAVVASLETGATATALGKNEIGDWIQVDINGILGWVFAENVTLNVPIEELQIIEVAP